ncbi:MAG: hypothetical protein ABI823_08255 [Bryobacteraceae bacterium]
MKPEDQSGKPSLGPGPAKRGSGPTGFGGKSFGGSRFGMPMEWVGGSTWRLPSGKALAEFALQAGFLAPLMLGSGVPGAPGTGSGAVTGGGIQRRKGAEIDLPLPGTTEGPKELKTGSLPPRGSR